MDSTVTLEQIVAWAKRRGFIFQTSTIYGGLANNYDYGPYGATLKNNIRNHWWNTFVEKRNDVVGLDGAIITHPTVWEASGHTSSFSDPLVEDTVNHKRYRADHVIEAWANKKGEEVNTEAMDLNAMSKFISDNKILSEDGNALSDAREFNLLFETHIGAVEAEKDTAYLRGETAQSIFVNYKNILDTMRVRIPFGIAQIGKAFRNEITKGQFIFRTIEFEQMEIEYFIHPEADWDSIMQQWLEDMKQFYLDLGADSDNVRFREHDKEELSHYSKRTYDPEFKFDFGWKEIAGLAYRTDFDLSQHAKFSSKKLEYRDPQTNEVYVPHVVEPSFGLTRAVLVALYSAYKEEDLGDGKSRVVMKFPAHIAPVKAAIFPLQKDDKLVAKAEELFNELNSEFQCEFDNAGNIGKMYRRQDEIGTPFCITVDYDTLEKGTVTIRDRDTMEQETISIDEVKAYILEKI
ncbi:glycine--tRNA ligase [Candidatus Dojkabacteria bacterium]|uniref:glycine--tRNA ligase n=1 Tax=Candidatus Dojkabacteria bacterium TaxID=2099670 RepID=A0A955L6U8_9BACT|nr:glycine--tRNA ligase [Candidatus Dojkabacteria bacterium]